jgi:hypothetical protein
MSEKSCIVCGKPRDGGRIWCGDDACLEIVKAMPVEEINAIRQQEALAAWRQSHPEFTCPLCGSHYFGRDIASDGTPLDTVRCHGDSSAGNRQCSWQGAWPPKPDGSGVYIHMTPREE